MLHKICWSHSILKICLTVIVLHSSFLSSAENQGSPSGILVLDYQMEEESGNRVKDSSSFHNEAYPYGLPYDDILLYPKRGKSGHALRIGRDSAGTNIGTYIPHSESLRPSKFIIEFEIKPDEINTRNITLLEAQTPMFYYRHPKIGKNLRSHIPICIRLLKKNRPQIQLSFKNAEGTISTKYLAAKFSLPIEKFTQIRYVFDGEKVELFLNGEPSQSWTLKGEIVYDHPDYFPNHTAWRFNTSSFHGEIDNFQIRDLAIDSKKAKTAIKISAEPYLNFFAVDEKKSFKVGIANFTNKTISGTLSWQVSDHEKKQIFQNQRKVTLKPRCENQFNIEIPSKKRGCFWLNCEFHGDKGESSQREEQYSVGAIRDSKQFPDSSPFGLDTAELSTWRPHTPDLGMKWARLWLHWKYMEPKKGELNWSYADKVVDHYHKRGFKILVCFTDTPAWAIDQDIRKKMAEQHGRRGDIYSSKYPPKDLKTRKEFLEKVIKRYRDKVDVWEVWNEANCGNFRGTPEQYMALLKQFHPLVRTLDPTAKVAGPSICCTWGDGWTDDILSRGAGDYFDIFLCHYMGGGCGRVMPENSIIEINHLRKLLEKHNMKAPVWDGEFGYYAATRRGEDQRPMSKEELAMRKKREERFINIRPNDTLQQVSCDEMTLSQAYVKRMILALSEGFNRHFRHPVGMMKYESDLSCPYNFRKGSGMLLPAISWTAMVEKLSWAKFIRRIDLGDPDLQAYLFQDSRDDSYLAVMWRKHGTEKLSFQPDSNDLRLYDLWGNETSTPKVVDGRFSITLTESPLYLAGLGKNAKKGKSILGVKVPKLVTRGEVMNVTTVLTNPFKDELNAEITIIAAKGVKFENPSSRVNLKAGEQKTILFPFTVAKGFQERQSLLEIRFQAPAINWSESKSKLFQIIASPLPCPYRSSKINIDGKWSENEWPKSPVLLVNKVEQVAVGSPPNFTDKSTIVKDKHWFGVDDLNASARLCWDEKNLYFTAKVNDNFFNVNNRFKCPWTGDCVELFIDARSAEKLGNKLISPGCCQIAFVPGDKEHPKASWKWVFTSDKSRRKWKIDVASSKTEGGYIIEAKIPMNDEQFPSLLMKAGRVLGFDYCPDDSDLDAEQKPSGKRKVQMVWRGSKDNFNDPSQFGRIILEHPSSNSSQKLNSGDKNKNHKESQIDMKQKPFTPKKFKEEKTGWLPDQKFKSDVKDEYMAMALHYWVPENFAKKQLPLIIYLHGGGRDAGSPKAQIMKVPEDHNYHEAALGDFWEKTGAVVVAPQVYPNEGNDGWCDQRTEDFLASVILEAIARFNIDPNRVFLVGESMGGFGTFHIMQNYPERFAGIVSCAGAWSWANFKNSITTPIWILHGAKDAVYKKRPHFTDIQHARTAVELFKRDKLPVNYRESEGGHRLRNHIKGLDEFWKKSKNVKRDSAFKHIYLSTPSGYSKGRSVPVSDRGWITINELKPGEIEVDTALPKGKRGGWKDWDFTEEEFNAWRIDLGKRKLKGGWIDAKLLDDNQFEIKTKNIKQFTVWMNKEMVDFSKPVKIVLNGKVAFEGIVEPSEKNIEECYKKRKDLGLLYEGKVVIMEQ